MRDWRQLVRERLPRLPLPGPREQEIHEELALQLEEAYEEARAAGAGEAEAEAGALSQLGDWRRLAAEIASAELGAAEPPLDEPAPAALIPAPSSLGGRPGRHMWDAFAQDLRHGLRVCAATPGVTALATAMLALGIGANAAIFSLVDGILLRPLPYAQPERLVSAWQVGAPKG
ncbi:MAG TPA: hypothetical protein VHG32_23070, partial [Thermoanaerobaculia bacterium]|nr:hypothetical protein [Thermoanaerobaculia bacterium]